jgi:recombinational DNA repair protein RecT
MLVLNGMKNDVLKSELSKYKELTLELIKNAVKEDRKNMLEEVKHILSILFDCILY